MGIKLLITKDVKRPDFMGCGAYDWCVENNAFHIVIPKGTIVTPVKGSWETPYGDVDVNYDGDVYYVSKRNCTVVK